MLTNTASNQLVHPMKLSIRGYRRPSKSIDTAWGIGLSTPNLRHLCKFLVGYQCVVILHHLFRMSNPKTLKHLSPRERLFRRFDRDRKCGFSFDFTDQSACVRVIKFHIHKRFDWFPILNIYHCTTGGITTCQNSNAISSSRKFDGNSVSTVSSDVSACGKRVGNERDLSARHRRTILESNFSADGKTASAAATEYTNNK